MIDLTTGESIATLHAAGASTLVGDGRFVFAVAAGDDAVTIIDGGSWATGHGDHFHYFVKDPAVLGTHAGPTPIHTVVNDGQIVVFFDGDGTAASFTSGDLAGGEIAPWLTITTPAPQHGVVAGLAGHHVVSVPAPTAGDLPTGVQILHGGDELEADFSEDCPELHGEAAFTSGVLFACDDGALWVEGAEGSWAAHTIEWPATDEGEARAWSFAHSHGIPVVAGIAGEGLVTVDVTVGTASRIAAPGDVITLAVVNDGGELLVITRDGTGHLVDVTSGEVVASAPLVSETPADVAGYHAGAPKIVVSGARAYVSDAVEGAVIEVATNDDLRIARTFEVGVSPGSLAVVGDH